jgi:hypothetical protein
MSFENGPWSKYSPQSHGLAAENGNTSPAFRRRSIIAARLLSLFVTPRGLFSSMINA